MIFLEKIFLEKWTTNIFYLPKQLVLHICNINKQINITEEHLR